MIRSFMLIQRVIDCVYIFNIMKFEYNEEEYERELRVSGQVPEPSIFNVRNGTYSKNAFR